jgi:hypothetical protein
MFSFPFPLGLAWMEGESFSLLHDIHNGDLWSGCDITVARKSNNNVYYQLRY